MITEVGEGVLATVGRPMMGEPESVYLLSICE